MYWRGRREELSLVQCSIDSGVAKVMKWPKERVQNDFALGLTLTENDNMRGGLNESTKGKSGRGDWIVGLQSAVRERTKLNPTTKGLVSSGPLTSNDIARVWISSVVLKEGVMVMGGSVLDGSGLFNILGVTCVLDPD